VASGHLQAAPGSTPALDPHGGWFRTLQQALQLEAERGFTNLVGRREQFNGFLARSLRQPESGLQASAAGLQLAERFVRYDQLTPAQRQVLVAQCRQHLHSWRQQLRPPSPLAPPRLRLAAAASPQPAPLGLDLHTPLAEIRGVGPKTASRLAQLGLFVVRDLVHYYPRDYLDYANLVRISWP
jgi:ATP-dependent DNA helicase RecG